MQKSVFYFLLLFLKLVFADYTDDEDDKDNESEFETDQSDYEIKRCNPYKDANCLVSNEALGRKVFESFSDGTKYFTITSSRRGVRFDEDGLTLTILDKFDNPALASSFYIMYGKIDVEIKGAPGKGIISSFYLQSDDLDEIDVVEIFGSDPYEFQTNFFIKGNVSNYDRGKYHQMHPSPLSGYHKYSVEWTPDLITWFLNDKPVRMLGRKNRHGMPCSPMFLKFSLWSADENDEGTIAWAGGVASFSEGPFSMHIKNLEVHDYSNGISYNYGHLRNGKWLDFATKQPYTKPIKEWENFDDDRDEEEEGSAEEDNWGHTPDEIIDGEHNDYEQEEDDDEAHDEDTKSGEKNVGNADKEDGYDETNEGETQDEEKTTTIPAANLLKRPVKKKQELAGSEDKGRENPSDGLSKKTKKGRNKKMKSNSLISSTIVLEHSSTLNSNSSVTTESESILSTSTSKARLPYNIFFQYPDRDNSIIKSGVSNQISGSLLSVVFVEALIVMTLLV
ncbi:Extracellular glycosidase CRH12 [Candida tropicalis]